VGFTAKESLGLVAKLMAGSGRVKCGLKPLELGRELELELE
jgi:hypothetical protein